MTNVSVTPETLAKLVADAVAKALADRKETAVKAAKDGKSEKSMKNEIKVVRAFKKAGFGDVKVHVDVRTYNRWLAEGRRPKKGEHALKITGIGFRLFHISQTEVISDEEKAAELEKMQAAIRRHNDGKKGEQPQASA